MECVCFGSLGKAIPAMAEDTLIDQTKEKIHHGDSSSSDSDDEKSKTSEVAEAVKSKIFRLLGREKPVHKVLGGGKRMNSLLPISLLPWLHFSSFVMNFLDKLS